MIDWVQMTTTRLAHDICHKIHRVAGCHLALQIFSEAAPSPMSALPGRACVSDKASEEFGWYWSPPEKVLSSVSLKVIVGWLIIIICYFQAQALEPFPDLTQPEVAFIGHPRAKLDPSYSIRMNDVYLQILDMEDLVERAREAIVGKAETLANIHGAFCCKTHNSRASMHLLHASICQVCPPVLWADYTAKRKWLNIHNARAFVHLPRASICQVCPQPSHILSSLHSQTWMARYSDWSDTALQVIDAVATERLMSFPLDCNLSSNTWQQLLHYSWER